ncbi:hypothetical protein Ahy_A06g030350 [Arachis hypogaea]|uniref:Pentatricopeptide repeat-containing protein n=1 Tax=Arachis hypogaea TaxID=3818 RepID=A0A445CVZ0_ARAHY|nr:hypothetical protein Ahy_A06g030350 [Arachis hypogaea]
MKKENVRPTVVTYGTLIEGYCRMRRVEKALEIVGDMIKEGIAPNAIVLEEAFAEFEDMIRRGIVPQYLTFQRLNAELKKQERMAAEYMEQVNCRNINKEEQNGDEN